MNLKRVALVCAFGMSLLLAAGPSAEAGGKVAKIDKAKLVGTWNAVAGHPAGTISIEFAKDGKATLHHGLKGKTTTLSGAYSVKGNMLEITTKEKKAPPASLDFFLKEFTIVRLDNTALVIKLPDAPIFVRFEKKGKKE